MPPWAHAGVREVALLVSNHSMRVGDRGVIIVGGSAQTGDLAGHFAAGVLFFFSERAERPVLQLPAQQRELWSFYSMRRTGAGILTGYFWTKGNWPPQRTTI